MNADQKSLEPVGRLYPTHPGADNSRYSSSKRSQLISLTIDLSTKSSPTYLPPHWSAHVQPEGKQYFYHDGELAAVTESWMYSPEIATEAEKWIDQLTIKIKEKGIDLASAELYIRIDEDSDCLYYGVDKRDQTLFWIEEYGTEELGFPPVVSPSHLRTLLEVYYWSHIDRFPAHFGGLPESVLLKLCDVMTHCRMDQITSTGATFSYSPVDTVAMVKVLKACRGRAQEPEIVSTIARAWHLVQYNRYEIQYGEEVSRLDLSMSIKEDEPEREGLAKRIFAFLSFGQSEKYRAKLNSLNIDKNVYAHRFHAFITDLVKEWKEQYLPSFCMLFLHLTFFQLVASQTAAAVSAAFFSTSLLTAFALVQQHDSLLPHHNCADEAVNWISDRCRKTYNFQRIAFALALPRTFFNWGLIVFFGQWLYIALSHLSTRMAVTFLGIIGLLYFAFFLVTAPETIPTFSVPRCFRRKHSPEDESMV
ncbi:hypothetical protein AN958_04324 [Leucoagaricus sp. SymC.cos]|nr:hypothetical protein AN958_04324 [Leucoagaricus sp. SymC.cos]